jgi:hypothetical protein
MNTATAVDAMITEWTAQGLSKADIVWKLADACMGWPYVFGAWGEVCTPSARGRRKRSDYPTIVTKCPVLSGKAKDCSKCQWGIGCRMYDCRGFTRWLLQQVGLDIAGGGATSQWNNKNNWVVKGEKKDLPPSLVACVFMKVGDRMNHTGMHLGNGEIIHCANGVQTGKISQRGWTHFAVPKGLYEDIPDMPVVRPTLRKGCKGEYVRDLQEKLISLGYDVGKTGADGIFGKNTRAGVMKFQAEHGLVVDGIVGIMTWGKLYPEGE